jgi:two-component system chemotaxis sensor kinase CheA
MALDGINADILCDFVTESRELIEATDQDLVSLEQRPDDQQLINAIFRAMHTIKGSSSFLALDPITSLAHAAEDALNSLRQSAKSVTGDTMDLILRAVDLLREQIETVDSSEMPGPAPEELLTALRRLGSGGAQRDKARDEDTAEPAAASDESAFTLPPAKKEILEFVVEDMTELLDQLAGLIQKAAEPEAHVAVQVADLAEQLRRCSDFFEVQTITAECTALHEASNKLGDMTPETAPQILPRMHALVEVMRRRAVALGEEKLIDLDSTTLRERLAAAAAGEELPEEAQVDEHMEVDAILAVDGSVAAEPEVEEADEPADTTESQAEAAPPAARAEAANEAEANAPRAAERTIRVDVDRLESLLNLVGELVLQKNRVIGIGKRIAMEQVAHELSEELTQVGGDLDQITSDLQLSVMKTRMQPLSKLFNRYPRVIRDISRNLGKKINLQMDGGDTEVDKSVIESLGDPLVHLLRNSADHGVEPPDVRTGAGKDATGTIHLSARHEGNNVLVTIRDDGKGLDGQKIASKAIEKGLISSDAAAGMSVKDMQNLIFMPGFSTAEKLSDVSGRGVGMDVVRTNIAKLNGTVDLQSQQGVGTTVSIRIPLTVAIMPALMVDIRSSLYAVPISNIQEIVRPEQQQIGQVGGSPVLRLRDSVLPLVNLGDLFDGPSSGDKPSTIAVIVGLGEKRLGLLVDGLAGQEEVVIKPLDDRWRRSPAICGATVREDGSVSLIIDIAELFKTLDHQMRNAA